jgi:hypothetical protein
LVYFWREPCPLGRKGIVWPERKTLIVIVMQNRNSYTLAVKGLEFCFTASKVRITTSFQLTVMVISIELGCPRSRNALKQ